MAIEPIDPAVRIIMLAQAIGDCANAITLKRFDDVEAYMRQVEWNIEGLRDDCMHYFKELMDKTMGGVE